MASPPSWLAKHAALAQPPSQGLESLWVLAAQFKENFRLQLVPE